MPSELLHRINRRIRNCTPASLAVALLVACGNHNATTAAAPHPPCQPVSPMPAKGLTIGMTHIAGGGFLMGAKPLHDEEGPPRQTTVGSFWIDTTEVTNRDFAAFVEATGYVTLAERALDAKTYPNLSPEQRKPSSLVFVGVDDPRAPPMQWWAIVPGADWRHPGGQGTSIKGREAYPVVQIAWADAKAYAEWLGRDLPTEAEWEYAARGGIDNAAYAWGDTKKTTESAANIWQGVFPLNDTGEDGYKAETAPVGCFKANGYGLFDMAGNVWEWTADWYSPGLDPTDANQPHGPAEASSFDPAEPGTSKHVIKGGSFLCADNFCLRYRPPAREAGPTDTGSSHIGFRTILRETAPH